MRNFFMNSLIHKKLHLKLKKATYKEGTNSPGKRCIRTLTILSSELKTKLQRQTINAHANGPCNTIKISRKSK